VRLDVSPTQVRATAALAHLDLRDDEIAPMTEQLRRILEHVASLASLDLSEVPSTPSVVEHVCPLCDDVVVAPVPRALALAATPFTEDGTFVVPPFASGPSS
jgi:aspartyl-tRNA(Asn)/glutamyl-tRNA(Gln) amidotransferase subunit C